VVGVAPAAGFRRWGDGAEVGVEDEVFDDVFWIVGVTRTEVELAESRLEWRELRLSLRGGGAGGGGVRAAGFGWRRRGRAGGGQSACSRAGLVEMRARNLGEGELDARERVVDGGQLEDRRARGGPARGAGPGRWVVWW